MGGTMKMLGMPILQGAKDFSRFAAAMKECEADLQVRVSRRICAAR
ncbi:MAG: hypothetical protein NC041_03195 [Bacteroides sp.]|nr:hypothetical protein [Prevotella sp.]MCM1408130.1 hypothetical protein [Treponema brennaborense]MCM1469454.1 hypothetical protein [Bacteroides sp.]